MTTPRFSPPAGLAEKQAFLGLYATVQICHRELKTMELPAAEETAETLSIFPFVVERDVLKFSLDTVNLTELKLVMVRALDQLRMIVEEDRHWRHPALVFYRQRLITAYLIQKQALDAFDPLALSETTLNVIKDR